MKTIKIHLKIVAFLISSMVVFQSCSVYKYRTATVTEAVNSGFTYTIKLKSADNNSYKFMKLEKKDGMIYGIVKNNSKTASTLSNQITEVGVYSNNDVKILMKEGQFEKVYIKGRDKTLSTILNVGIPLVVVGGIIWIGAETYPAF